MISKAGKGEKRNLALDDSRPWTPAAVLNKTGPPQKSGLFHTWALALPAVSLFPPTRIEPVTPTAFPPLLVMDAPPTQTAQYICILLMLSVGWIFLC